MDCIDENDICCLMQEDIKRRDLPRAALLSLIVAEYSHSFHTSSGPMNVYKLGSDRTDIQSLQIHIGIRLGTQTSVQWL